jgi:stearoyl-CoA desaturase (delta-9 desaturase)
MWRTRLVYNRIFNRIAQIDPKFVKDVPDWAGFDKFASNNLVRILWIGVYVAVYFLLDAPWWLFPLILIHAVMGPFHGVIINWFAHTIGYINFKMKDTSRNLMPVDLLMWGEGLHNNHHKFSGRANFGVKKFEFDPLYPIIRFLAWAKVLELRKTSE